MNLLRAIQKLVITYLKTFLVGLVALFIIIMPMALIPGVDTFSVLFVGVIILFLIPGFVCGIVLLPISLIDKKREGLSVTALMKKYLPYVLIIPLLASIVIICVEDRDIEKVARYIMASIYLISIMCLYMYCRTVKSPR